MPSDHASHAPGIDTARRLRADMPLAERRLWARLRRSSLGHRFRRQHPIGDYVADFACVRIRLIVEVDGPSHYADEQATSYDARRTAFFELNGWSVVRLSNLEVARDVDAACRTVRAACEEAALSAANR